MMCTISQHGLRRSRRRAARPRSAARLLPCALLAGGLARPAPAAEEVRLQTLAELQTLDITVPVARLAGTGEWGNGRTPYLHLWVSDDGLAWTELFGSGAYFARHMSDPGPKEPHDYYAVLESFPAHVRAGTTGWYTGPVWVDGLEIIAPDGTVFRPTALRAVNNAQEIRAARAIDGMQAFITHSAGQTEEETWQVDAVEYDFTYPPGIEGQIRPMLTPVPLPPTRWGVYTTPGGNNDPHHTPPGYTYWPQPEEIAWYDFSVLQGNVPEMTRRIKEINPDHRVIVRAYLGGAVLLDYAYDMLSRDRIVSDVLNQIAPTPDLVHAVTLNEEEPMYLFWDWWSSAPPAWLAKYSDRYEQETGNAFVHQSEPLREWLKTKAVLFCNDLYDRIKAVYPAVKVFPFMYVPDDISGLGWIDPAQIQADGWVYQWYNADLRDIIKPCRHALPQLTEVGARDRWFNLALQHIRGAGVPMDEVYVQIWLHGEHDDYRPQLAGARAAGVENVFCFYFNGWIPPEPPQMSSPHDLALRVLDEAATAWPGATHEAHPVWLPVAEGRAQSFIAEGSRVASVSLHMARPSDAQAPLASHTVTLEGNGRAIPDGRPLATAWLAPEAVPEEGWIELTLAADVQPGAIYWIALRPDDGAPSQLRLGATDDGSFPGGQCIAYESWGGYYNSWRTYDTSQLGIGHWPASYAQRTAVEALISPPELTIEWAGNDVRVSWTRGGALESADRIDGTWARLQDAQSGVLIPAVDPARFFRVTR